MSARTVPFPRGVLLAAGTAITISIAAAALGRMTGFANSAPTGTPVITRELLFRDMPDGEVAVFDARDPATPIALVARETNGFLRATMRGLAQQRLRQDADVNMPFRLTAWASGRLTLQDAATGRRLDLEAFGITNEEAFARLLTATGPS
jgi:putative photosynthetic complex assembly protein